MRAAIVFTYIVILCCVIDTVCANIHDFIVNMSQDIGNAIHSAWTKISKVIKRPVRIRRFGKGVRRKRTTSVTLPVTAEPDVSTIAIYLFNRPIFRSGPIRHTIPVMTTPLYKSAMEWRKLQVPYIFRPIQDIDGATEATGIIGDALDE